MIIWIGLPDSWMIEYFKKNRNDKKWKHESVWAITQTIEVFKKNKSKKSEIWFGLAVSLMIEIFKKNRNDKKSKFDYIWQLLKWS